MTNEQKVIVYIGNFLFPLDNAAGKRVYANCCILRDLGYRVICICNDTTKSQSIKLSGKKEFEGIDYYSFPYSNGKNRLKYFDYYKQIINLFNDLKISDRIKAIFIYSNLSISYLNIKLLHWSQKKNIKCFSDCADWFNPPKGNIFLKVWKKIDTDILINVFNPSTDGVVCISKYLSNYYKKKKTVVIPPLTNTVHHKEAEPCVKKHGVSFVYAGSKFRAGAPVEPIYWKDRIDLMIKSFYDAKQTDSSIDVKFMIIGITKKEFIEHIPSDIRDHYSKMINELNGILEFCDYIPHDEVEQKIRDADFTILIRDKKRMTMAGFPTKIPESISCGTPVLCNDTSDIKDYIVNNKSGFIVDCDKISETIVKISHLNREEIQNMKEFCLLENPFYYKNFSEKMSCFIGG